jgi:hypothetical protein
MDDYNMYEDSNNILWNDRFIYAQDALIESISTNNSTGYVTIAYGVMGEFDMIPMEVVTLIVTPNTIIREQFGQHLTLEDLSEGMTIDAIFSSIMTRSFPPQSNAYSIIVKNPEMPHTIRIDRILCIEPDNNFLYTGDPNNVLNQMRFVVTDATIILDRDGNKIQLNHLRPGQMVRVDHANFQTASIPPQTTAFFIQVI